MLVALQLPAVMQESERVFEYCILQSMVHLALQATTGLDDDSREKIFDQFTKDKFSNFVIQTN